MAKKRANGPRYLTARQVADVCDINLKTVHNWVDAGKFGPVGDSEAAGVFRTPGRHLRFTAGAVVAFLTKLGYPVPADLAQHAKEDEARATLAAAAPVSAAPS